MWRRRQFKGRSNSRANTMLEPLNHLSDAGNLSPFWLYSLVAISRNPILLLQPGKMRMRRYYRVQPSYRRFHKYREPLRFQST